MFMISLSCNSTTDRCHHYRVEQQSARLIGQASRPKSQAKIIDAALSTHTRKRKQLFPIPWLWYTTVTHASSSNTIPRLRRLASPLGRPVRASGVHGHIRLPLPIYVDFWHTQSAPSFHCQSPMTLRQPACMPSTELPPSHQSLSPEPSWPVS